MIEVYPNCQLGAAREMFEAVQMGNLDIVESGSMVLGNFTDQIKFLNLPFLFNGREAAVAWKQTEENQQLMQSIAEETGLYEFGYVEKWFIPGGDERKNRKNTARFAGNEIPIPGIGLFYADAVRAGGKSHRHGI